MVSVEQTKAKVDVQLEVTGQDTAVQKAARLSSTIDKLIIVTNSAVALFRRMGYGEEYAEQIDKIQRLIMLLNLARATMLATAAASGPLGWAYAGVGIVGTVLAAEDTIASLFA